MLAVAAGLRVAHVLALRDTPWFDHLVVDPEYYDAWARRIAAGDWLGDRAFYMDPLYPYVLGALYRWWGRDLLVARLLNVACSTGACLAVGVLGRRVGGPLVGVLAALGLALYEPDVFYVGELDKTSLSMLLAATFLALAFARSLAAQLGAGFALGLTVLTRANFLVFAPLAMVAPVFDRGARAARIGGVPRALVATALFAAGFALAIAPVAWRNHVVSGRWVLTTSQMGQNFYTGNNPTNPYGAYGAVPFVRSNPHFEEDDFRAEAEQRAGRPLDADAVSSFWFHEALAHMRADPAFAARALARKLFLFWSHFEISDNQDQYLLERSSWVLRLPLLGFGAIVPLAFVAMAACGRRRAVRLLVAFVGVYWISLAAFFLFSRYRIQVVPALLPLAALGAVELAARLRARDPRRLAASAAVLGAGAVLSFSTIGIFARDHPLVVEMRLRRLADAYMDVGDAGTAIAALQEAVAPCPTGCPWALKDLFEAYMRSGRLAEGEAYFRRFVADHPEQLDAPDYVEQLGAALRAASPTR